MKTCVRKRCGFFAFSIFLALSTQASVLYVNLNSSSPTPPYGDWSTAATDIQSAIDAASVGDQILVTNGVYQTGGRAVTGSLLNRVVVSKALTVQSVNGPAVTLIQGYQLPGTIIGDGAIRCVYLTNSATLIGFTLTNGATRGMSGTSSERYAGGIYCRSASAVVSNCVIVGNAALTYGGGAYQGSLYNCTISGNTATNGGGVYTTYLSNCNLYGNSAFNLGGGSYSSTNVNCAFTNNSAVNAGGGAYSGTLTNCTLTGNSAGSGGGVNSSALYNCILQNNSAVTNGGGVYSSTLRSCALVGNTALLGGGAYGGVLTNCTLTGNSATAYGGGTYNGTLDNCIIYYNTAPINPNCYGNSLNVCCTTPMPSGGSSNIVNEPQFASSFRLTAGSPCRGAGSTNYVSGTDIDGEAWASPPSMGCDEFYTATGTGSLTVSIQAVCTNVVIGTPLSFYANIIGAVSSNLWSFGDGTFATNQLYPSHSWNTAGNFPVVLRAYNSSNPGGISATVAVHVVTQQVYYVSASSGHPLAPYNSWATAAKNIQDAVNAATVFGGQVLVTNGIYSSGGQVVYGSMSNRVAVTLPLLLKSVNGPAVTTIAGYWVTGTTNGNGAVRCVYLTNGAALIGFTLTNGATRNAGDSILEQSGGGLWCPAGIGLVSNCVFAGNSAFNFGGGAYSGNLTNCTLTGNFAGSGGGAYLGTLNGCILSGNSASSGGGAFLTYLSNCTLTNNSAPNAGGANSCTMNSCLLIGNLATNGNGGGVRYGSLNNCSLINNYSSGGGGGACAANLTNCVLIGNQSGSGGGAGSEYDTPCIMVGCLIASNSATSYGGGVDGYTGYQPTTIYNSTIIGNATPGDGGGADSGTFINCIISGNSSASGYGGGVRYGTLTQCIISSNSATTGGGISDCTANSCVIVFNSASQCGGGDAYGTLDNCNLIGNSAALYGGGDYSGTLNNCISYLNNAAIDVNCSGDSVNFSCTTPLPSSGSGNISADPLLADICHLSMASPCRAAGNTVYATGTDIDGEPWGSPPSMGCDEFHTAIGSISDSIQTVYTNISVGYSLGLSGNVNGIANNSRWNFGDGTTATNQPLISHVWTTSGNYAVVYSAYNNGNPGGINATTIVHVVTQPVHYVALGNANPVSPYSTWFSAATNIQDAVSAATMPGAMILVSNGVYSVGGQSIYGQMSNRVAVVKPLVVKSMNGPVVTIIEGMSQYWSDPYNEIWQGLRCVYLTNGASLYGFTLTNGSTMSYPASYSLNYEQLECAAGVWAASPTVVVSNCVITGCSAHNGGGAYSGTLVNCTLSNNYAMYGGGTYYTTLTNCLIINNAAIYTGYAIYYAGGSLYGTLNNCTLVGNITGGAYYATLNNCISYDNDENYNTCTLNYCCTTPLPAGPGNFTNDPAFMNWTNNDFHLQSNSPCINSGNNSIVSMLGDLDGNPRIKGGTVDIGAYEYQTPSSILSYAWAQQYGLPTDSSVDYLDLDGTGMKNWQKSIAGLNPTNPASVLAMLPPVVANISTGVTVSWQSVNTRTYYLQRATNLAMQPAFSALQSNLVGQAGTTSFTDTTATNGKSFFYRVGVQ
jgi:hypothetical protein